MKYTVMCQCKMRSVHHSRKRVIIAVVELVSLRCHSGVSHYDIAILMQSEMNLVSGIGALVNREFAIVIKGVAGSVCASFLTLLGKHTKQLFTLLRIQSMIIIYQAKNGAHN